MRSRTVSDVFAILFAREEKWGTLARNAWVQFVSRARTQEDPAAATVTRSDIQGLSEEESRELHVARRGLGSQRGAGGSVALSQIEYNMG